MAVVEGTTRAGESASERLGGIRLAKYCSFVPAWNIRCLNHDSGDRGRRGRKGEGTDESTSIARQVEGGGSERGTVLAARGRRRARHSCRSACRTGRELLGLGGREGFPSFCACAGDRAGTVPERSWHGTSGGLFFFFLFDGSSGARGDRRRRSEEGERQEEWWRDGSWQALDGRGG